MYTGCTSLSFEFSQCITKFEKSYGKYCSVRNKSNLRARVIHALKNVEYYEESWGDNWHGSHQRGGHTNYVDEFILTFGPPPCIK